MRQFEKNYLKLSCSYTEDSQIAKQILSLLENINYKYNEDKWDYNLDVYIFDTKILSKLEKLLDELMIDHHMFTYEMEIYNNKRKKYPTTIHINRHKKKL